MAGTPPEDHIFVSREKIKKWRAEFERESNKVLILLKDNIKQENEATENYLLPIYCEYFSACLQTTKMLELILKETSTEKIKLLATELITIQAVDLLIASRR